MGALRHVRGCGAGAVRAGGRCCVPQRQAEPELAAGLLPGGLAQ